VIPRKYQSIISGEIGLSLETGSLKLARPMAASLTTAAQEFLRHLVLQGTQGTNMATTTEIRTKLSQYLRDSLKKMKTKG
jgi:hypothetical protein